jgi:predicted ribosomally synthesized peptide with SipW-like signal peptide
VTTPKPGVDVGNRDAGPSAVSEKSSSLHQGESSVNRRAGTVAFAAAAIAAVGGVAVSLSGMTFAAFSDTETSTPTTVGAATVVLGHSDSGPELGYAGLRPGAPQSVELTVTYEGTVAADLTLAVTPDGEALFCEQRSGRWAARPGASVTVRVDAGDPVPYCSLYDGERLSLGTAQPDSELTATVTLTLAGRAATAGQVETDIATVHADGGFSDEAAGSITVATAPGPGPVAAPGAAAPAPGMAAPLATVSGPPPPDATVPPASTPPAPVERPAVPAECAAAGMTVERFTEVVVLDAAAPEFDGSDRPGPLLVLGTSGPDRITGSTAADCIAGGGGDDELTGGPGDDVLVGGSGVDALAGGEGRDRLDGGPGAATCDATPDDQAISCLPPPAEPAPTTPVEPVQRSTPVAPPSDPATAAPTSEPAAARSEIAPTEAADPAVAGA